MLNNCTFIGRWSKDLEIIQTDKGTDILNTSIAVSDPFDKDNPLFLDVKAFNKQALNAHQFTQKGSKVGVTGKLQLEKWTQNGQNRSKHVLIAQNIVFLDEKGDNNQHPGMNAYKEPSKMEQEGEPIDISSDSLPF